MEMKERARQLRAEGKTYSEISNETHVAKSTLFYWISDIKPSGVNFDKRAHLERIRKLASEKHILNRLQRTELIRQAVIEEIPRIDIHNKGYIRTIAAMLY